MGKKMTSLLVQVRIVDKLSVRPYQNLLLCLTHYTISIILETNQQFSSMNANNLAFPIRKMMAIWRVHTLSKSNAADKKHPIQGNR